MSAPHETFPIPLSPVPGTTSMLVTLLLPLSWKKAFLGWTAWYLCSELVSPEPFPGGLGREGGEVRSGRYLRLGGLQSPRWCFCLHCTVEGLDVLWGVEACWAVVLSSDHPGGRSCGSSEGHCTPIVCTSYVPYFLRAKEQRQQSEVLRHAGECDRATPQPLQWPSCVVSAVEQVTTTTKASDPPQGPITSSGGWKLAALWQR